MQRSPARIRHKGKAEFHDYVPGWILPLAGFEPQKVGLVKAGELGQMVLSVRAFPTSLNPIPLKSPDIDKGMAYRAKVR